jgi:hypothetical protein
MDICRSHKSNLLFCHRQSNSCAAEASHSKQSRQNLGETPKQQAADPGGGGAEKISASKSRQWINPPKPRIKDKDVKGIGRA